LFSGCGRQPPLLGGIWIDGLCECCSFFLFTYFYYNICEVDFTFCRWSPVNLLLVLFRLLFIIVSTNPIFVACRWGSLSWCGVGEILSRSNVFRFCRPTPWCWEQPSYSVDVFSRDAPLRLGHPAWCWFRQRLPTALPPRCFGCLATESGHLSRWERECCSRVECRRGDVGLARGV